MAHPETIDPAREYFAAEVESIARELEHVSDVSRVEGQFALDVTQSDGKQHRFLLENIFSETRDMSPDERRARVVLTVTPVTNLEPSWEEAREMLVPVLRGATFGSIPRSQLPEGAEEAPPKELEFVRRPFAPFVDIFVVLDFPTRMAFVSRGTIEQWNLSSDEVIDAALARLVRIAPSSATIYDEIAGPLFIVSADDTYEASRLLIPGWLASFRGKVEGAPVAIIPQRSLVMIGGSARPAMVARLVETASREYGASPRKISTALYTVDDTDRVVPYLSGTNDVRIAHEKLAMAEYGQQKALLEEANDDLFVATYRAFQRPDGHVASMSTWTKTVDTLLPKTDRVGLVTLNAAGTGAEDVFDVPWDAVAARLTRAEGLHPARWRTGTFPDDAELASLHAAAQRESSQTAVMTANAPSRAREAASTGSAPRSLVATAILLHVLPLAIAVLAWARGSTIVAAAAGLFALVGVPLTLRAARATPPPA